MAFLEQILNHTTSLLQPWEEFKNTNKLDQSHLYSLFYFGRCIPWIIVSKIKAFDKYKLQPNKIPSKEDQWKCTKYYYGLNFTVEIVRLATIVFVFEDFFHYWAHRALHQGQLYKKIHKLHHEFSAPFGLAAEYAHPLEILILGTGTIGGPLMWCVLSKGNLHILTMYIWIVLRLFRADHHDYHHEKFVGCYSTSFRWMDTIFGTDKGYHEYRKKQKLAKLNSQQKKVD
ncbi:hypothetical protein PSTT_11006 [Puccinia striiformis]|uniref:Fatty acid hydroxylase domain-containing protein n=1 Tax=Puccinia striiformis TaxID=27350 RepID=A0A2S4V1Y6_9BASI|nr:hypothetical protein PSTT_11006 [Puccinia striiformis]